MTGADGPPFDSGPVVASRPTVLEPEDEKVLQVLARDGRASLVDLGAAAGLTTGRASRRLDALLEQHVVHLHVELAAAAIGLPTGANVWLRVRPAHLRGVGRALAALPEVGFAAAMSGRDNLFVQVHCRDLDHVFALTSDRIGRLRGVESAEVDLVHRLVKQAGSLVDTAALAEALREGRIHAAALDVYEGEPLPPAALLGFDNAILTPHIAGISPEAIHASVVRFLDNASRHFAGLPLLTPVN